VRSSTPPPGSLCSPRPGWSRGANPALALILGRELTELVGGTLFTHTHPDDLPAAHASCAAMATGSVTVLREKCRLVRPDTAAVWVRVSTTRVEAHGEPAAHLIMHVEDISEHKALEVRLLRHARHNPLTGLRNRALLHQRVTTELAHPAPGPPPTGVDAGDVPGRVCALVMLDLDHFKALNDAYGHPAGAPPACIAALTTPPRSSCG
jgi:PAS domain S-box-containing protein